MRDRRSEADRVCDAEANAFALFLLMPNPHFVKEMRGIRDLLDEKSLEKVAKKFRVSVPILLARDALERRLRWPASEISGRERGR
jgi:Zn-dependent peptidase ImmA (M78 family)